MRSEYNLASAVSVEYPHRLTDGLAVWGQDVLATWKEMAE